MPAQIRAMAGPQDGHHSQRIAGRISCDATRAEHTAVSKQGDWCNLGRKRDSPKWSGRHATPRVICIVGAFSRPQDVNLPRDGHIRYQGTCSLHTCGPGLVEQWVKHDQHALWMRCLPRSHHCLEARWRVTARWPAVLPARSPASMCVCACCGRIIGSAK